MQLQGVELVDGAGENAPVGHAYSSGADGGVPAANNFCHTTKLPGGARLIVVLDNDNLIHFRCPIDCRVLLMAAVESLLTKKLQIILFPNGPEVVDSRHACLPYATKIFSRVGRWEIQLHIGCGRKISGGW